MPRDESQSNDEPERLTPRAQDSVAQTLAALRARTPARLVVGRAGPAYRTATQLELRADHAEAVDAVRREMDLLRDLGEEFLKSTGLIEVVTLAIDKEQFLQRPELGRALGPAAQATIRQHCPPRMDLQVAFGDGLSAAAIAAQVPALLPLILAGAAQRGWTVGKPVAIRHCRVGVLNDLGAVLEPEVIVLLIGERPGLATAESLSAYMAFRPRPGHTDAQRNLISNIHARGIAPAAAAERILNLAEQMRRGQTSGVAIKEQLPPALASPRHLPENTG